MARHGVIHIQLREDKPRIEKTCHQYLYVPSLNQVQTVETGSRTNELGRPGPPIHTIEYRVRSHVIKV